MIISDETINVLFDKYCKAAEIDNCYVDASGISTEKDKTDFKLMSCDHDQGNLLRVAGFCVAANSHKDLEIAFDILFGDSLSPANIASQARANEMHKHKYYTILNPAFDSESKQVIDYTRHKSKKDTRSSAKDPNAPVLQPPVKAVTMLTGGGKGCKLLSDLTGSKSFAEAVKKRKLAEKKDQGSGVEVGIRGEKDLPSKEVLQKYLKYDPLAKERKGGDPRSSGTSEGLSILQFEPKLAPASGWSTMDNPASLITSTPSAATCLFTKLGLGESPESPTLVQKSKSLLEKLKTPTVRKHQSALSTYQGTRSKTDEMLIKRAVELDELNKELKEQIEEHNAKKVKFQLQRSIIGSSPSKEDLEVLAKEKVSLVKASTELEKMRKELEKESEEKLKEEELEKLNASIIEEKIGYGGDISSILGEGGLSEPDISGVGLLSPTLGGPSSHLYPNNPPALDPMFSLNRSLVLEGEVVRPRKGILKSGTKEEKEAIAAAGKVYKRSPVDIRVEDLNNGWMMTVYKYIIGDSLAMFVEKKDLPLVGRVVYSHTYSKTEGLSSEEEEDEDEGPTRKRRKRRCGIQRRPKRTTIKKSRCEAEKVVMGIEATEKDMASYMTKCMHTGNFKRLLQDYKELRLKDGMSDSQRFADIVKDLHSEKSSQAVNISESGSDLRENLTYMVPTKSNLQLNGAYMVAGIKIVSDSLTLYKNAMDFLVVEGMLSDYEALKAIITFRDGLRQIKGGVLDTSYKFQQFKGQVTPKDIIQRKLAEMLQGHLLNVSNVDTASFLTGYSYWMIGKFSDNNIHYLPQFPICSNNKEAFSLAIFYLYEKDVFTSNAQSIRALHDAIDSKTPNALVEVK